MQEIHLASNDKFLHYQRKGNTFSPSKKIFFVVPVWGLMTKMLTNFSWYEHKCHDISKMLCYDIHLKLTNRKVTIGI